MTKDMSQGRGGTTPSARPTPDERLEQLGRVLRSRVFHDSELLMTLLQYLVDRSTDALGGQVKEYTIALEVFGRDRKFDPRTNSIVRVQAKNLRAKLQTYFETEGRGDSVLIEVPKGGYQVVFSYIQPRQEEEVPPKQDETPEPGPAIDRAPAVEAAPVDRPQEPLRIDLTRTVLTAATIILAGVVVFLVLTRGTPRDQAQSPVLQDVGTEYPAVWGPFIETSAPTLAVLSNPSLYRFLNNSDSESTAKEAMQISPEQARALSRVLRGKPVMRQGNTPRLVLSTSSYTGIGEAIGLHHLTDLFRSAGKELQLKQSRTVAADDFKNYNVILLGSVWVNDWVEKIPVEEDFAVTLNASIENRNPLAGEDLEYKPVHDERTGEVKEDYALITVRPGITEEHRVMILAGLLSEGTQGAAEFVTRKEYLVDLDRRLREMSPDGPPKYYQVLLRISVDNGIPTAVEVVALHPLRVTSN